MDSTCIGKMPPPNVLLTVLSGEGTTAERLEPGNRSDSFHEPSESSALGYTAPMIIDIALVSLSAAKRSASKRITSTSSTTEPHDSSCNFWRGLCTTDTSTNLGNQQYENAIYCS